MTKWNAKQKQSLHWQHASQYKHVEDYKTSNTSSNYKQGVKNRGGYPVKE